MTREKRSHQSTEARKDSVIAVGLAIMIMVIGLLVWPAFGIEGWPLEAMALLVLSMTAMKHRNVAPVYKGMLLIMPLGYVAAVFIDPYIPLSGITTLYESFILNSLVFMGYLGGVGTWLIKEHT